MKLNKVNLRFWSTSTLVCFYLLAGVASAQDYLVGTWSVQGSDFSALGLNLSGGSNPSLVVTKNGTQYTGHISQDVFVSEINCQVSKDLNLLTIVPASASNLGITVTYPFPYICINRQQQYEVLVSNLAADNNSFKTCRVDKPEQCLAWVRLGTTPPTTTTGTACSSSLTPTPPTATVAGKSVTITDTSGASGVKTFVYELSTKPSKRSPTIKRVVSTKISPATVRSLSKGTWRLREKIGCTPSGSSKFSAYTGFTVN